MTHIYVIGQGDGLRWPDHFVKIGIANNPRKRLDQLQTGNPFPLDLMYVSPHVSRELAMQMEAVCHRRLHDCLMSGEWFVCHFDVAIEVVEVAMGIRKAQPRLVVVNG